MPVNMLITYLCQLRLQQLHTWLLNLCVCVCPYSFACRFGLPVVLRVRRNLTHTQFQSVLLHSMCNHLKHNLQELQDVCYYDCTAAHTQQAGTVYILHVLQFNSEKTDTMLMYTVHNHITYIQMN